MFPAWIGQGLYGYRSVGRFLDIGIPEAYATAEQFFAHETLP
jgi:NDP-sugar pyrophosphorylase family protein